MSESYQELRQKAANYYAENAVAPKLEEILNKMFYEQPNDVYGRLSEYFEEFALTPNIVKISANKVMDGVGAGGLQCSVSAEVKNHPKVLSSLSMSLEKEISMLPLQQQHTTDSQISKDEVLERGCMHISESISSKLNNVSLLQQTEVDLMLRDWIDDAEYDKFIGANQPTEEDDGHSRTPTPSSGRKKKTSSGKAKGCTAASAVSVAVLKAAANFLQKPVFEHLRDATAVTSGIAQQNVDNTVTMPTPAMVVLSGGKSAPGKLHMLKNVFAIAKPGLTISESISNLIKVYQNVGKGLSAKSSSGLLTGASGGYEPSYDKPEQPLDAILEAINTSGLVPGQDIFLGIQCSAHEIFDYDKGKYEISTGTLKTADEFLDLLKDLVMRYPSLIMIIDPLRREDREQWKKLCEMVSEKCFVIGSDVIYGSMHSLNDNMLSARKSSGLVISTGSRVTCSDLARVVGDIRARECVTIMTSPVGDVCDDIFSDLDQLFIQV